MICDKLRLRLHGDVPPNWPEWKRVQEMCCLEAVTCPISIHLEGCQFQLRLLHPPHRNRHLRPNPLKLRRQ